jgi:hypothetical protein
VINVFRKGNLYEAQVLNRGDGEVLWSTQTPVPAKNLIEALQNAGCHQSDIGDAFYQADPEWIMRLEDDSGA